MMPTTTKDENSLHLPAGSVLVLLHSVVVKSVVCKTRNNVIGKDTGDLRHGGSELVRIKSALKSACENLSCCSYCCCIYSTDTKMTTKATTYRSVALKFCLLVFPLSISGVLAWRHQSKMSGVRCTQSRLAKRSSTKCALGSNIIKAADGRQSFGKAAHHSANTLALEHSTILQHVANYYWFECVFCLIILASWNIVKFTLVFYYKKRVFWISDIIKIRIKLKPNHVEKFLYLHLFTEVMEHLEKY